MLEGRAEEEEAAGRRLRFPRKIASNQGEKKGERRRKSRGERHVDKKKRAVGGKERWEGHPCGHRRRGSWQSE